MRMSEETVAAAGTVPSGPDASPEPVQAETAPAAPKAPQVCYGCVFCTTGKEQAVARMIDAVGREYGVHAVAARQEKHKSVNGQKSKIIAVVLPSYVFFRTPPDMRDISWMPRMDVIRVLTYEDGDWRLMGSDAQFAEWLYRYDGLLGFSTAYKEGERIRIISGPLKDMEGCITRIDKRGRSGQVAIEFNNKIRTVWLGFDLINSMTEPQNEPLGPDAP